MKRILCCVLIAILTGLCATVHGEMPSWCFGLDSVWAHNGEDLHDEPSNPRALRLGGYLDASWINAQGEGRVGSPSFQQGGVGVSLVAWPLENVPVQALLDVELLQRPVAFGSSAQRDLFVEQAAARFELPWAFSLRAGVFLVPFGLEDDRHAGVVNPLVSRPEAMFGALVYPGSWVDTGATLSWVSSALGSLELTVINSDPTNQRLAVQVLRTSTSSLRSVEQGLHNLGSDTQPNDTNASKSIVLRAMADSWLPGLNLGASLLYAPSSAPSEEEALPSALLGAHLELDGTKVLQGSYWPSVRSEFVYGYEGVSPSAQREEDWTRWGLYAQLLQPLPWRFDAVFRYEFVEPDRATLDDEFQAFAFGARHRLYTRVHLKAEYRIRDENATFEIPNNTALAQIALAW